MRKEGIFHPDLDVVLGLPFSRSISLLNQQTKSRDTRRDSPLESDLRGEGCTKVVEWVVVELERVGGGRKMREEESEAHPGGEFEARRRAQRAEKPKSDSEKKKR